MYKVKRKPTLEEFKEMVYQQKKHPLLWRIERYRRYKVWQIMEPGTKNTKEPIKK